MDESGQGHHGQVHGARYDTNGKWGGAMSFDGQDDYISTPDISLREFPFAAWVCVRIIPGGIMPPDSRPSSIYPTDG